MSTDRSRQVRTGPPRIDPRDLPQDVYDALVIEAIDRLWSREQRSPSMAAIRVADRMAADIAREPDR